VIRDSQEQKMGRSRDPLLHHSDRGTPPVEATPDGSNSLYCFNFSIQRGTRWPQRQYRSDARVVQAQLDRGKAYPVDRALRFCSAALLQ
jgi:hypothetical protein